MKKSKIEKRKKDIVDYCFRIIHLWLKNPEQNLSWVLRNLEERSKKTP